MIDTEWKRCLGSEGTDGGQTADRRRTDGAQTGHRRLAWLQSCVLRATNSLSVTGHVRLKSIFDIKDPTFRDSTFWQRTGFYMSPFSSSLLVFKCVFFSCVGTRADTVKH